jgi:hypothetical protein
MVIHHNNPIAVHQNEEAYARDHCIVTKLYITKLENRTNTAHRMYATALRKAFAVGQSKLAD